MKKSMLFLLILLVLVFASCDKNDANDINTEETSAEETTNTEANILEDQSLFAEGSLDYKEYSNIAAIIDYYDDETYKLKIRIEQKDVIIFNTPNQNVYADINTSSDDLDNGDIVYQKDVNEDSLYEIPLVNNQMPMITDILIDKDSPLLTTEEHQAILNKERGLWISVQIRDPQGYILEISNTIFEEH